MRVCKLVQYWGRVQGVGFRYTTRNIARGFPVTGYVRNLNNGQVELAAQGEADDVTAFLAAIAENMAGYIEGHEVRDQELGDFEDFRIRH